MSRNWEFGEYKLDFFDKKDDKEIIRDRNEIEDLHKEKLINKLESNFNLYKKYFHISFFYFKDLQSNIKEAFDCLIFESNTASITLTNHILEKALKLALTYSENVSFDDWEAHKKNYKRYAEEPMGKILSYCKGENKRLINEEEYNELMKCKEKYRDGFSHYSPSKILKNDNVKNIYEKSRKRELSTKQVSPSIHNHLIENFSKENAEDYLKFVVKVICHLDYKLFKFSSYQDEQT